MTIKTKPSPISNFNSILEKDYEDLNTKSKSWYPLMYYNENIVLEDKNYITMGINPSLTDEAKTEINKIFEIKDFDVKVDGKGEERFNKFNSNRQIKNKLIEFQNKLKYDDEDQIEYFKTLEYFFKSVGKNFEEDVFHYDFCQKRNTASGDIKKEIKIKSNYEKLCIHFDEIAKLIKPDYIFIFNATLFKILIMRDFFKKRVNLVGSINNRRDIIDKDDFQYYNEFMDDNGVCERNGMKFIVGNQLSGGATSRVYRANLIANVRRLLKS
jgi:hypothetical protein